jgi:hypothetical protein
MQRRLWDPRGLLHNARVLDHPPSLKADFLHCKCNCLCRKSRSNSSTDGRANNRVSLHTNPATPLGSRTRSGRSVLPLTPVLRVKSARSACQLSLSIIQPIVWGWTRSAPRVNSRVLLGYKRNKDQRNYLHGPGRDTHGVGARGLLTRRRGHDLHSPGCVRGGGNATPVSMKMTTKADPERNTCLLRDAANGYRLDSASPCQGTPSQCIHIKFLIWVGLVRRERGVRILAC